MDLNLAPLKYRNILSTAGGPLEKIEVTQIGTREAPLYEAVAFLLPTLVPTWHKKSLLYSYGHGGGTHKFRNLACHIAISEAMERWAFLGTARSQQAGAFGFDIAPGTDGMAAFPGLTSDTARARADWEAVERWAISEWWMDNVSGVLGVGSEISKGEMLLSLPFKRRSMIIIWEMVPSAGTAYGFAAADNKETALAKARIEQARNRAVLNRFYKSGGISADSFISDAHRPIYDRRLLFFSSKSGNELFWEKVVASSSVTRKPVSPDKKVDREIPGPWSRYATVWRTVYSRILQDRAIAPRHDVFMF